MSYGFGLVPLAPLFSLVCALVLRRRLRGLREESGRLPGLWPGLALGVATLAVLALPMIITKVGLQMAASDSPAESQRGIRWLRRLGPE